MISSNTVDPTWKCEFCQYERHMGLRGLDWGSIHGQIHCTNCGARYSALDNSRKHTLTPRCIITEKFQPAFKLIWDEKQINYNDVAEWMWDEYLKKAQ